MISVIIPTYNSAETILNAVKSVLNQDTTEEFEIIVIDDGSTDSTESALKEYESELCIINQTNQGVANARNKGIEMARGDFIAFLDADDRWKPDKIRKQMLQFNRFPDTGLVSSAAEYVGESGIVEDIGSMACRGNVFEKLLFFNFVVTSSVVVKREVLRSVQPWFKPHLAAGGAFVEDWELWLRLAGVCDFLVSAEPLVTYFRSCNTYYHRHSIEDMKLGWRSLYGGLRKEDNLRAVMNKNWFYLMANVDLLTAMAYHRDRNQMLARKFAIKAMIGAPGKISWFTTLSILLMPYEVHKRLRSAYRNLKAFLGTKLKRKEAENALFHKQD